MAALIRIRVQDPQDVLDTFGAGALIRIERSTSATMSGASEITTVAVVAGTTEYEYRDTAGTPGTDYYWTRYSKASPSVADDYSGYSAIILAGALDDGPLALETIKTWSSIPDTDDDGWLALAVRAMNRAVVRGCGGISLGPNPASTLTVDAEDAVRDRTRLYIAGGIRSFTAVQVSTDGSTWTAVTSDVRIGPPEHERGPGDPGLYIEFRPYIAGGVSSFSGYRFVKITGTAFEMLGGAAWPDDIVQDALSGLQRMSLDRDRQGQYPTETSAMRYLNQKLLRAYAHERGPAGTW